MKSFPHILNLIKKLGSHQGPRADSIMVPIVCEISVTSSLQATLCNIEPINLGIISRMIYADWKVVLPFVSEAMAQLLHEF